MSDLTTIALMIVIALMWMTVNLLARRSTWLKLISICLMMGFMGAASAMAVGLIIRG